MTPDEWVLSAPTILTVAGLDFTVHAGGQHIVVYRIDARNRRHEYHLWPSTGRWRHKHPSSGWGIEAQPFLNGVRDLVRYMQEVLDN